MSVHLRRAMSRFATGVTVVTTVGADGTPYGTTANAFTSVSLDPPLLLICLAHTSRTRQAIEKSELFAINVLGSRQQDLAHRFARKSGTEDCWSVVEHAPGTLGAPILSGALAAFECRQHRDLDGGDHRILIGEVVDIHHQDDHPDGHDPLVFYGGTFAGLDPRPLVRALPERHAVGA
jgi:flavin reductase (DIM6/NTAB) family NADH-FMN oxidoreductase RutF